MMNKRIFCIPVVKYVLAALLVIKISAAVQAQHHTVTIPIKPAYTRLESEDLTIISPRFQEGHVIRGRVFDRDSRVTLPGANIIVLNTDPLIGSSTDLDGIFVLHDVPLGRHDIQASFLGYEPLIIPNVLVTSGKEVFLEIGLREQAIMTGEVVVVPEVQKEQPLNDMAIVSARSFSVEETRRYAGGLDDPARMASAFAGVASASGVEDNALIIRGNAPKGVLWRLEGVEIPNPNHFAGLSVVGGGGLTLFSGQLLANSDFFTGAFPAEYGNALSGVFDINFRSGNPSEREHTFQIGLNGIEVASEGPFTPGSPSTYLFNYRYSTLALIMPFLPTEAVAKYQDLSFKLSFPTQKLGRFEVWGLGGLDGQTLKEERDSTQWEYDFWDRTHFDLNLGVGATGISHDLVLGQRSYVRSTAGFTINRTSWDQDRLDDAVVLQPDLDLKNTTGRFILSSFLNSKLNSHHINRTGFAAQQLFFDFSLYATLDNRPPLVPISNGDGSSTLFQLYTQSRIDLSRRISANLGLHGQYFALTNRYSLEPRIGLRWQTSDRHAFSFGYGLHSQIEDLRIYFVNVPSASGYLSPNKKLDFTKAHHLVLGYDHRLNDVSRLKLETYYQSLFDVPVIPDSSFSLLNFEQDWQFNDRLINTGAGKNYGIDLTLERFLRQGYYFLVTGSLFKSEYRGGDDIWRGTRFDQRYTFNALFGKEFSLGSRNNLLGINGRLLFTGGKRRSPVDIQASLEKREVVYDEYRAFSEREPNLFLLDLTLSYRRNKRHFSDVWALQVKNALGARDVYYDYNYKLNRIEEIEEGYPLPVLSYKIEF